MGSNAFTIREQELQALAWQCFDEPPKVNYQKLADLAGMSNPVSACNAWSKIKKKLAAQAGNVTGGGNSGAGDGPGADASKNPEKKTKTPSKRKKKADSLMGGDEDERGSPMKKVKVTPAKGKKNGSKGGKKVQEEKEGNGEGEGEDEVKVKGEEDEAEDVLI